MESNQFDLTSLTADIVSAYVANNALTGEKIPELISSVYGALSRASRQAVEPEPVEWPAVAIKKSVTPEYIVCLEDGQKFKSLKRHLKTDYDMSPEEYREKWGLPRDYPMVAPSYAAARSDLAKNMGFVVSGGPMKRELGIRTLDLAKRMLDFGVHPPTVYFPQLIDECLLIEPTETETRETLEAFAGILAEILAEAEHSPETARNAPYTTPVRRLDEASAARSPVLRQPL